MIPVSVDKDVLCDVVEGEFGSNGGNRVRNVEDEELHLREC